MDDCMRQAIDAAGEILRRWTPAAAR
jgi:hypothetical protein